jgi:predicted dehydrogenase
MAKGAGETRRGFLKRAAAASAAFSIVPRHVLGGAGFVPPSEKVSVGIIGAGGMGMRNARSLLNEPEAQVAAVCDVAESTDLTAYWYRCHAGRRPTQALVEKHYSDAGLGYRCGAYEDFRVMLDKERGLDAVLVATPDHSHAFITVTAMRLGKHVYCEKPLAHNIWETRRVAQVAKEAGVATQMGNHGHSSSGMRATCEWVWDGAIGAVREVHAWSPSRHWRSEPGRPAETPPVPAGFNWDLWLGPREVRPYHPAYAPYIWRDWWAFGTGSLGNLACHNIDAAVWALKLESPVSVEAVTTGGCDSEVAAYGGLYTYHFGPRGEMPPVKMTWYDGGLRPPVPEALDPDDPRQRLGDDAEGLLLVGDKGWITCPAYGGAPRLLPLALHKEYKRPEPTLPRVKGHHADWLSACKGGPAASSNFETSARLTEVALLGNVALRAGKKIKWDAAAMKATNAPEADAFIREACRKGWEIG